MQTKESKGNQEERNQQSGSRHAANVHNTTGANGNHRIAKALVGQMKMEQTIGQLYTHNKQSNGRAKEHKMAQLPHGHVVK